MLTKVYVVTSCKIGTVPINNTLSCYLYCIRPRLTIAPIFAFCCTVAVTHRSRLMTILTTQIFPTQLPNSDPSSYQMTQNCNLSAACPSSPCYCIRSLWTSAPFYLTSILHFAWMGSGRFFSTCPCTIFAHILNAEIIPVGVLLSSNTLLNSHAAWDITRVPLAITSLGSQCRRITCWKRSFESKQIIISQRNWPCHLQIARDAHGWKPLDGSCIDDGMTAAVIV